MFVTDTEPDSGSHMHSDEWDDAGAGALRVHMGRLRPGVPMVHVGGRLDHRTGPELRSLLDAQVAMTPWAIVLDLTAVSVLEPGAVPALTGIADRAGEVDVGLYLVSHADWDGSPGSLSHVLAAADVLDLFEIHPTIDSALRALNH